MRYFLIGLIASCILSCGRNHSFVNSSGEEKETVIKPPASDAPVEDISNFSPVIIAPENKEDFESVETDSGKAAKSDGEVSVTESVTEGISVNKAKSDEEFSVTEKDVSKPVIRKPVIDPENQMAHQLIAFVKSELEKDGRKNSPIFDRYIEKIVRFSLDKFTQVEIKKEDGNSRRLINWYDWKNQSNGGRNMTEWVVVRKWIDVNKWLKRSGFFEVSGDSLSCELESSPDDADFSFHLANSSGEGRPSCKLTKSSSGNVLIAPSKGFPAYKDRDSVFGGLAFLDYQKKKEIGWSDFIEGIKIGDKLEQVLFIVSLSGEYTRDFKPDRIVIMHSPSLDDFIRKKGVFKTKEALDEQGRILSQLVSYVKAKNTPVHVLGLCDYFCSSYVIPNTKEVYIEPFGEVAFNGSHEVILETFKGLLIEAEVNYWDSILREVDNLDDFSKYVHGRRLNCLLDQCLAGNPEHTMLVDKIRNATALKPFYAFSAEEKKIFLGSLSVYERRAIWNVFHANQKSPEKDRIKTIQDVQKRLQAFHNHFPEEYFDLQNYDINRFYHYSGLLTNSSIVKGFYPLPMRSRLYVSKEEDGILYTHISPESGILRNFGINIHGENSGYRKYVLKYQIVNPILPISSMEVLKNCGFFTYGASFNTPKKITRCFIKEEEKIQKERGIKI